MNAIPNFSTGDVADRLSEAPKGRERLIALRQMREDAAAVMRPVSEQLQELFIDRQRHTARFNLLTGPGYALKPTEIQVMQVQQALDRANADIARLTEVQSDRSARWNAIAGVVQNVEGWLASGVPGGTFLADAEPIDGSALLKKNESLMDGISRIRHRGRELQADLHRVRCAPHPSPDRKAAMRLQVAAMREAATPSAGASIAVGDTIEFPTTNQRVQLYGVAAIGAIDLPDVYGALAWLFPDQMVAALDKEIGAEADDKEALSDTDRQLQETTILSDLLANDRADCSLVELGRTQGIVINYRSDDCSPLAILGVEMLTASRAAVSAPSPIVSLVSKLIGG